MDNILKIYYIKKHYPNVALFVQTSPAFCCPSLITEAMAKEIEKKTGTPVVSITYDGTGGTPIYLSVLSNQRSAKKAQARKIVNVKMRKL